MSIKVIQCTASWVGATKAIKMKEYRIFPHLTSDCTVMDWVMKRQYFKSYNKKNCTAQKKVILTPIGISYLSDCFILHQILHCCIKCSQILQVKPLLQTYTAFTYRIDNEKIKISFNWTCSFVVPLMQQGKSCTAVVLRIVSYTF